MGGLVTEQEKVGSGGDLDRALADLRALSGDMASCAVLSADGVLLSSPHDEGVDRERAAAMLSAVANLAERAARREGKEHVSQVRVDAEDGHLLLVRLEGGGILAATTGKDARVGLVLYDMRNAKGEIGEAANAGGRS
jgi:predicted regulator of Ras-like GTPase activity (Roadblock/LC7/MglB family)